MSPSINMCPSIHPWMACALSHSVIPSLPPSSELLPACLWTGMLVSACACARGCRWSRSSCPAAATASAGAGCAMPTGTASSTWRCTHWHLRVHRLNRLRCHPHHHRPRHPHHHHRLGHHHPHRHRLAHRHPGHHRLPHRHLHRRHLPRHRLAPTVRHHCTALHMASSAHTHNMSRNPSASFPS